MKQKQREYIIQPIELLRVSNTVAFSTSFDGSPYISLFDDKWCDQMGGEKSVMCESYVWKSFYLRGCE